MYVAGNADNYPIEYYDEDKKSFCGVIPDLLEEISNISGLNFVYINGNKGNENLLGENLQADIVSSASEGASYGKEYYELITYKKNGEIIKSGIVFTTLIEDNIIYKIKTSANGISIDEKNGILLSYTSQNTKTNFTWIAILLVITLLLTTFKLSLLFTANFSNTLFVSVKV